MMNVESFRDYCLSLPDSYEKMPFAGFFRNADALLVFYVGEKMFCMVDIDRFDKCTLKSSPEEIEALKDEYEAVEKPFNLSPKYWIGIRFGEDMPEGKVLECVRRSYEIVASAQQKKSKRGCQ